MKDFMNGKAGLAKTFWLGVFAFNAAMRVVTGQFNILYLQSPDDRIALLDAVLVVVLVLQTIWLVLMLRAVALATFRHAPSGIGRKIGGVLGLVFTLFGVVYSAHAAAKSLWPSVATPPFFLQIELRQYQRILPQSLGDGVTLVSAEIEDGVLVYGAQADFSIDEVDEARLREIFSLADTETQELCREMAGYMRGGLEAVMYDYTYTDGHLRVGFTRDECLGFMEGGGLGRAGNK